MARDTLTVLLPDGIEKTNAIAVRKRPGVYRITNTANGRNYVGSSARVGHRLVIHRWALRRGLHDNSILQRAWNKHGEAAFEFAVLVFVDDESQRLEAETAWIAKLKAADKKEHGYNLTPVGGTTLGRKMSGDELAMHSLRMKNRRLTEEHKRQIGDGNRGQKRSPEFCELRRQYMLGRKDSEEARHNKSLVHSGRPRFSRRKHTPEIAEEIRTLHAAGMGATAIARKFGMPRGTVRAILEGRSYTRNPLPEAAE